MNGEFIGRKMWHFASLATGTVGDRKWIAELCVIENQSKT